SKPCNFRGLRPVAFWSLAGAHRSAGLTDSHPLSGFWTRGGQGGLVAPPGLPSVPVARSTCPTSTPVPEVLLELLSARPRPRPDPERGTESPSNGIPPSPRMR